MIPEVDINERKLVSGLDEDTIVWKKALIFNNNQLGFDMVAVKLTIPKNADVVISKHKCRASYAKVEGIYPVKPWDETWEPTKPLDVEIAYSYFKYPIGFLYRVGKKVYAHWFNYNPNEICSGGIHFFRTYKEAAEYDFT